MIDAIGGHSSRSHRHRVDRRRGSRRNVIGTTTAFFTEATSSGDITFRDQQGSGWQAAMNENRLTTVETNAAIDERATSTAFLAGRVVSDSYMLSGSRPQLTTAFSLV